jgi:hypothetical protein
MPENVTLSHNISARNIQFCCYRFCNSTELLPYQSVKEQHVAIASTAPDLWLLTILYLSRKTHCALDCGT